MRKPLYFISALLVFALTACKHSAKEEEVNLQNLAEAPSSQHRQDKIVKNSYTDEFGDQLEVSVNETQNTVSVRLDGKSYDLKRKDELPEFTAGNAEYQFSDIKGEITFLRKGYNIVLFHHKREKSSGNTRMASF